MSLRGSYAAVQEYLNRNTTIHDMQSVATSGLLKSHMASSINVGFLRQGYLPMMCYVESCRLVAGMHQQLQPQLALRLCKFYCWLQQGLLTVFPARPEQQMMRLCRTCFYRLTIGHCFIRLAEDAYATDGGYAPVCRSNIRDAEFSGEIYCLSQLPFAIGNQSTSLPC